MSNTNLGNCSKKTVFHIYINSDKLKWKLLSRKLFICSFIIMECKMIFIFMMLAIEFAKSNKAKRSARKEGDLIIGALFPIHKDPKDVTGYTRTCGKVWEQYGIHRIEMFLQTLDRINNDSSILPNITLGYDIRDSCWYSPIALEQSIDFIKDSISSMKSSAGNKKNISDDACLDENRKPIVGLIGPGSSQNTIQVQNLLQIFKVPQIGYSATSMELSDKNLYQYFLRVVPSDKFQAQAMLDIVQHFNWTYISTVHTDGNYGSRGIQEFVKLTENYLDICLANRLRIERTASMQQHKALVETLMQKSRARVIICFCEGETVTKLYNATRLVKGASGQFLIIGSDGWADRPDVVENIEYLAVGGMSMKLHSPEIKDFDDYFKSLNPFTNVKNPWFHEFWETKFNCSMTPMATHSKRMCTGKEIHTHFVQDSKLGFVVNAISIMAQALHNMHKDVCGGRPGICPEMSPPEGEQYLNYLLNVSLITYSNDEIHFDENGDPPARYDVINYQLDENGTYKYSVVGSWKTGNLSMDNSAIYWPRIGHGPKIKSVCSEPCKKGFYKFIEGSVKCCWKCLRCEERQILLDESTCKSCSKGWWPNEDLTACRMIPVEYLSWFENEAMVAVGLACFGIFVTLWIGVIFIRHNDTPVVKASTRELSYIIMLGIIMAFTSNFVLVAKPTIVTCYFTRILPGLSFSLIYGALVTKTNRIARILEGTKKIITKKPKFMSASAQVIITCILVGIECAIITVMLIVEPADSMLDYPTSKRVRLICNTSTLGIVVPFGFDLILILMCTLYAIKTRNLPENFNEAKFIGFTMYTTCVIWLGFFAIYFGSEPMVLTLSVSISLSASVALVLLFFPKVYVIVWVPEKNTRSAFTTSKDVRCHIGSVSFHSENSNEINRDKKLIDQHGNLIHRKRSVFGKLKAVSREKIKAYSVRRESATLPPNMRLNRQNSTHVPANASTGEKFPWTKNESAKSDDEADKLSTISSKEESRSGSDKRKQGRGLNRQDSQCQTDMELFHPVIKKKMLRRRKRSNCSKKSSSMEKASESSESSINSDEIFLSLPFADCNDGRGVYRLSPRHSEKSPLLKPTDSLDKQYSEDNRDINNRCSPSYNFMTDFQKFGGSRDKEIPNEPSPVPQDTKADGSKLSSLNTNIEYENSAYIGNEPSKSFREVSLVTNGPLIKLNNTDSFSPSLHIEDSSLYNRRYNDHASGGGKRRSGGDIDSKPHTVQDSPSVPLLQHNDIDSPLLKVERDTFNGDPTNERRKSEGRSHTRPVYHSNIRHSLTPSVTSQRSSLTSMEDMPALGLRQLDEEEVSMMSFHDYMKNRGVELDLSAVQSSEV